MSSSWLVTLAASDWPTAALQAPAATTCTDSSGSSTASAELGLGDTSGLGLGDTSGLALGDPSGLGLGDTSGLALGDGLGDTSGMGDTSGLGDTTGQGLGELITPGSGDDIAGGAPASIDARPPGGIGRQERHT